MILSALSNSTVLVALDSILSADSEADMKKVSEDSTIRGVENIVLNFLPVDHMNSAGASLLVKLVVSARRRKVKLFAFGLGRRYREIFHLTGLSEGITMLSETGYESGGLADPEMRQLKETAAGNGGQDDTGWASNITKLRATEKPEGAMNKNVDGRRVTGPLQGFGPMWQKTYLLPIDKPGLQPQDVIMTMKQRFPEFQPPQNKFYPSVRGIAAGEIVLIDSSTPGGIVSTGVLVLYADDLSFTLMTPQGHPESGWVTFSAGKREDIIDMQIQGLARASDPVYELAFRLAGSKLQETIWKHVLLSLASFLGVEDRVRMEKECVGADLQWRKTGNLWYNAQIRSLPYNIPRLFGKR